ICCLDFGLQLRQVQSKTRFCNQTNGIRESFDDRMCRIRRVYSIQHVLTTKTLCEVKLGTTPSETTVTAPGGTTTSTVEEKVETSPDTATKTITEKVETTGENPPPAVK
ncbi:MAG: hypothetical protein ABI557_00190, partial [Aureliella sp.]